MQFANQIDSRDGSVVRKVLVVRQTDPNTYVIEGLSGVRRGTQWAINAEDLQMLE